MCSVTLNETIERVLPGEPDRSNWVERLVRDAKHYDGANRRSERRYSLGVAIRAVPVNDARETFGEAFVAVTRDISTNGISLYHTHPVSERFLEVELAIPSGESIRTFMEVLRCRPVGPLFEIAGKFVH